MMDNRMAKKKSLRNPFSHKKSSHLKKKKNSVSIIGILCIVILLLASCFIALVTHAFHLDKNDTTNTDTDGIVNDLINGNGETKATTTAGVSSSSSKTSVANSRAPIIAYAISLTSCNSDSPTIIDGAATLAHSIHMNSINSEAQQQKSAYDYKLYAFFHTSILDDTPNHNLDENECAIILSKLGFKVKVVDIPVPLEEIQNEELRKKLPLNGCCGEKEFIKLWSYTLTDHPFVVHLDLDTIVLRPMDELFDYALHGVPLSTKTASSTSSSEEEEDEAKKGVIMWNTEEISSSQHWSKINAFFTRDYNMRPAGKKPVGAQGGFLILRPSQQIFEQFQSIIRKGDFHPQKGWGGKGYQFYGAMTFQGIIPYFYDIIQPNTSLELNRCLYNAMADNPRDKRTVNNVVNGNCRDGRKDCEDCRERDVGELRTAHFTLCQKPWECLSHGHELLQHRLCRRLFGEWYKVRADLELSWQGRSLIAEEMKNNENINQAVVVGSGSFDKYHFRGFCDGSGKKGYIPMNLPE